MSELVDRLRELATIDAEVLFAGLEDAINLPLLEAHRENLRLAMADSVTRLRELQKRANDGERAISLAETWAEQSGGDLVLLARLMQARAGTHREIADLEEAMGELSAALAVSTASGRLG